MKQKKTVCCLLLLICLGLNSCGVYSSLSPTMQGALQGAMSGAKGGTAIGYASSSSEAAKIAGEKGYSVYEWNPSNGIVFGY